MFFIQIPYLPERSVGRNNWQGMVDGLKASSRPGTFSEEDFAHYRAAWSQPRAMTSMLNWYRAMFRYGAPAPRHPRILPPALVLWGVQDRFIGEEAADMSLALCDQARLIKYETATHWLQHELPDEVNRQILAFARD
jgi:pimeloyl-ACP methyl ester carboxylesterase